MKFTTPTDEQYHEIWAFEGTRIDVPPIHENEVIWLAHIPNIGLVLGGSDMGGSFDEQIVEPATATPEEVRAAIIETCK